MRWLFESGVYVFAEEGGQIVVLDLRLSGGLLLCLAVILGCF